MEDRTVNQNAEIDAALAMQARAAQHVEFFQYAVFSPARTAEEGRKVYENRDYVKVTQPGGRSAFVGEVKDDPDTNEPSKFILQYPKQWAQYKAKQEQIGDGMPLDEWTALSTAEVFTMKAEHIHTVDQLAMLNDGDVSRLGMGFEGYRKKAKLYLENIKSKAPMEKVMSELANERERHEATEQLMRQEIESLKELINTKRDEEPSRNRGGRPRKDETEERVL
jgi:hypothetical protein